jgi:hypothetical protein
MRNKIIVERLEDGQVIDRKEFKSLLAVSRDPKYSNLEYHQLRELYFYCTGKNQRRLQPFNKNLLNYINIIDNPEYTNVFRELKQNDN